MSTYKFKIVHRGVDVDVIQGLDSSPENNKGHVYFHYDDTIMFFISNILMYGSVETKKKWANETFFVFKNSTEPTAYLKRTETFKPNLFSVCLIQLNKEIKFKKIKQNDNINSLVIS